jgi:hypothetical protein
VHAPGREKGAQGAWQHPLRPPGARCADCKAPAALALHGGLKDPRRPASLMRACIVVGLMAGVRPGEVRAISHSPGVRAVEANPVSQTATVAFDTTRASVAGLRRWVEECGYHCAGQSVPTYPCDPKEEPAPWTGMGRPPMRRRPARRSP